MPGGRQKLCKSRSLRDLDNLSEFPTFSTFSGSTKEIFKKWNKT